MGASCPIGFVDAVLLTNLESRSCVEPFVRSPCCCHGEAIISADEYLWLSLLLCWPVVCLKGAAAPFAASALLCVT